jgi:hypothetical protein
MKRILLLGLCALTWIRLTAKADGSFTIQNGRNRMEKAYR